MEKKEKREFDASNRHRFSSPHRRSHRLSTASGVGKDVYETLQVDVPNQMAGVAPYIGTVSAVDLQRIERRIEDQLIERLQVQTIFHLGDLLPVVSEGMSNIVDDGFLKCFREDENQPWNWNFYLWVLWALGVVFRYLILFPIRALLLLLGTIVFILCFLATKLIKNKDLRHHWERKLISGACGWIIVTWTGVIKYHGTLSKHTLNTIYVANHSSMIDMIILQQMNTFSLVGQKHKGWVGFVQDHVLACLGCIWFNRQQTKDKRAAAERIKRHTASAKNNRLLVFPEGTCVNNKYTVMFKKGAFDLVDRIVPIAIKFNKTFVNGYWNSSRQSFAMHLVQLMCSWAVVCDVHYLPPMMKRRQEDSIAFASRVQAAIARHANLRIVHFDGYLKHWRPSERYVFERKKVYAKALLRRLEKGKSRAPLIQQPKHEDEAMQPATWQPVLLPVRQRNPPSPAV